MEYRHIPALAVLMPAGVKLLVVNPAVRRGMLLLQKENVVVLGGVVSDRQASSTCQHAQCFVAKIATSIAALAALLTPDSLTKLTML